MSAQKFLSQPARLIFTTLFLWRKKKNQPILLVLKTDYTAHYLTDCKEAMPSITGIQGGLQPALVCGGSPGQLNNIGFPCPPSHIQGFRIIQQSLHHSTALLMVV